MIQCRRLLSDISRTRCIPIWVVFWTVKLADIQKKKYILLRSMINYLLSDLSPGLTNVIYIQYKVKNKQNEVRICIRPTSD